MDTSRLNPEHAERLNAWGRTAKSIGSWALAGLGAALFVAAWWHVTSDDKPAKTPRTMDDSDDDDDDGGDGQSAVQTVEVVTEAITPGGAGDADGDAEDEGLGPWVEQILEVPESELTLFKVDMTDPNIEIRERLAGFMHDLQALQEVISGAKRQQLMDMWTAVNAPEVDNTPQQQYLMAMLEQFKQETKNELLPDEKEKFTQVFMMLQMQHQMRQAQTKLGETILELHKKIVYDAVSPEMKAKIDALTLEQNKLQEVCAQLEASGNAQEAAEKGIEFSVKTFNTLFEMEQSLQEDIRKQVETAKSDALLNENQKFARHQIDTEIEINKNQKAVEFVQREAPKTTEDEAGKLFEWFLGKQMAQMEMVQDPEQMEGKNPATVLEEGNQKLRKQLDKKLRNHKLFAEEYKAAIVEIECDRRKAWRDQMLEQQIAHERNEARLKLCDPKQREAMRRKHIEIQLGAMQEGTAPTNQQETDDLLEKFLTPEQSSELQALMNVVIPQVEARFLPKAEVVSATRRKLNQELDQLSKASGGDADGQLADRLAEIAASLKQ
eukprot:TRINITY_DN19953_c0_g1_i1.p1 TRINITY_DN19953_c0_g1~~TRINITY_DN19953_c0_g1_i1.p1  ORF type:complete len:552 (+),score=216.77 TRINITY_DN19953_c0_g1_i1:248-1903(+)